MPNIKADKAQVTWDTDKKKWQIRIQAGEEVIKRTAGQSSQADDESLRSLAVQTARDEGYELDASRVVIAR